MLAEQFVEVAETRPEVVAYHYEHAGEAVRAVTYYQRAGEQAGARSAHEEAAVHLRRGIALLPALPEAAERNRREAHLQLALGASLIAVRGYSHPETEAAYEQALRLCDAVGDVVLRASALFGLWNFYLSAGRLARSRELAERILRLGDQTGELVPLLLAHEAICITDHLQGKFASALEHSEQTAAIYACLRDRVITFLPGADQGIAARCYAAWSLWFLGYPDRALGGARAAIDMAGSLAQPFSLGYALNFGAIVHSYRREAQSQRELADQLITLSEAQGFPLLLGVGKWHRGAALAASGPAALAVAEVVEGLTLVAGTGFQAMAPGALALLAEVQQAAGQRAEAQGTLETALAVSAQTEQRFFDAELYRLKAELLLQSGPECVGEAEPLFRRALEIARSQEAKSLELRAATSLARLLQTQGKPTEARGLLAPIYAWFTEGFDTRDLIEAKALLEELG